MHQIFGLLGNAFGGSSGLVTGLTVLPLPVFRGDEHEILIGVLQVSSIFIKFFAWVCLFLHLQDLHEASPSPTEMPHTCKGFEIFGPLEGRLMITESMYIAFCNNNSSE